MKARKKPVVIDAIEFTGDNTSEVLAWAQELGEHTGTWMPHTRGLVIPTLEGDHLASPGDFIIRGVNGEFYPCKPDIFHKTYEILEEDDV